MQLNCVTETINYYERLTAGRHYDRAQKEKLFSISAGAHFLDDGEKAELSQVLFSPDIEECVSVQDCENGLLFEMVFENKFIKEILESRRKTVISQTGVFNQKLWEDRFSWVSYLRAQKGDYKRSFEGATFDYAIGNEQTALKVFEGFAANCDINSVKFLIAAYNSLGNAEKEFEYLLLYSRMLEELYAISVLPKMQQRIRELTSENNKGIAEKVKSVNLKYFSERDDAHTRMGF